MVGRMLKLGLIGMTDLSEINLNLLKILDALLTESHVTLAGKKMGLSQSATSTALKQIRDILGDPILVRGQGSQMFLTEYAKSIQGQVSKLIQDLSQLFYREPFVANTTRRTFHVGMSDYLSFVLLPDIIDRLNKEAPHVKLIVHHLNYFNDATALERGELDLVLGYFPDAPLHIDREALYEDSPVFVAHQSHPIFLMKRKITLKEIVKFPLIMVSFMNDPTDNYLDRLIKMAGLEADVNIVVPHALIALLSLKKNNYITHTVKRIAEPIAKQVGLKWFETPQSLIKKAKESAYVAHQYWYKTTQDDQAHVWLRRLILEVATKKS